MKDIFQYKQKIFSRAKAEAQGRGKLGTSFSLPRETSVFFVIRSSILF